jgi:hypothetical protein
VLDAMIPYNISLQTLDGILCHNGELPLAEYKPYPLSGFGEFDRRTEACTLDEQGDKKLIPMTLEGCLVRICDMLAYLGKDRQDAIRAKMISSEDIFSQTAVGRTNAEVINNLEVNLIAESYGKPYLRLDEAHFAALKMLKKENYERIYLQESVQKQVQESIVPMMAQLYAKILDIAKREGFKCRIIVGAPFRNLCRGRKFNIDRLGPLRMAKGIFDSLRNGILGQAFRMGVAGAAILDNADTQAYRIGNLGILHLALKNGKAFGMRRGGDNVKLFRLALREVTHTGNCVCNIHNELLVCSY